MKKGIKMKRKQSELFELIEKTRKTREKIRSEIGLTPEKEETEEKLKKAEEAKKAASDIFNRHKGAFIVRLFEELCDIMEKDEFPPYTFTFDLDEKSDPEVCRNLANQVEMSTIMLMNGVLHYMVNAIAEDHTEDFEDGRYHLIVKVSLFF